MCVCVCVCVCVYVCVCGSSNRFYLTSRIFLKEACDVKVLQRHFSASFLYNDRS